jgi:hypothetical protein
MIDRSVVILGQRQALIAPAVNSWRHPYSARRKLRRLRGRLFAGLRRRPASGGKCSLLTLTVAQSGTTPEAAYKAMCAAWNALATWWRKRFPQMAFFRVVEFHKTGFPHFHVLLVNAPWIAQHQISSQWARLLGQAVAVVDVRAVKGTEHAIRYVTKYLLKQQGASVAEASWWGSRVRPWSASRGLLEAALKSSTPWWDSVHVQPRLSTHAVAELAHRLDLDVLDWDDQHGFYKLGRAEPS